MLRRLVGGRSRAAVLDEGRNAAQSNRTAESDLFAEFFRGSNPSLPLGAISAGKEAPLDLKIQSLPGEGQCKYTATWQRARAKLKSRLMITKLRKELNLFGSNYGNASHSSAPTSDKGTASLVFRKCILPPHSLFLDVWQLILALSILYTATVFPFRMAFVPNAGKAFIALDLAVDICFVVDVGINLNSAYINADFELVTSRKRICRRYFRGWLLFDVLSCLPVATNELWFGETTNHGSYSELLRLFRLPRLYRLVKIISILDVNTPSGQNRLLERCKDVLKLNHGSVKLLTTVLMISIATHIAACFLYLDARVFNFEPDTWVERLGEADASKTSHYISCVYWAVTTLATVGYGDINGLTVTERLLCICWMFCGIYFFSFAIGSLTSFLSGINTKENMLVSKLAVIEEFAHDARLSTALKNELRIAVQYSTGRSSLSWDDKQTILGELPKKLRYEVAMAMHQGAAKTLLFFEGKDPVFISTIVPFMQPLFVKAKSSIFQQGEYADEIYFLVSGRVSYVLEEGGFVYRTLQEGSNFGDIEVVQMCLRRYSVSAAVDSNLLTMKKPLVDVIQTDFPAYWSEMKALAEARDSINENSRREFLNLLALKKAGRLDKSDPKTVREKLRRISAPRKVVIEYSAISTEALKSDLEESTLMLTKLQKDAMGLKRTADEVIALLGEREKHPLGPPLSLELKARHSPSMKDKQ